MHPLRFKALFEVADNYYHAGDYRSAIQGYQKFLDCCSSQLDTTEERGWIDAYTKLSRSRLTTIGA